MGFSSAHSLLERRLPYVALPLEVWTDLRRHLIWTPGEKVLDWDKLSSHVQGWGKLVKKMGFDGARAHVNQLWADTLK